jgi:hypothetical protein
MPSIDINSIIFCRTVITRYFVLTIASVVIAYGKSILYTSCHVMSSQWCRRKRHLEISHTVTQIVLALWTFTLRNFVRAHFHQEMHAFGLPSQPNTNSHIRNTFWKETRTCERKKNEREVAQSVRTLLCCASCIRLCYLLEVVWCILY